MWLHHGCLQKWPAPRQIIATVVTSLVAKPAKYRSIALSITALLCFGTAVPMAKVDWTKRIRPVDSVVIL